MDAIRDYSSGSTDVNHPRIVEFYLFATALVIVKVTQSDLFGVVNGLSICWPPSVI